MSIRELNRDQIVSLKQKYLAEDRDDLSWGELAEADSLVSDDALFDRYGGVDFCEEDFA